MHPTYGKFLAAGGAAVSPFDVVLVWPIATAARSWSHYRTTYPVVLLYDHRNDEGRGNALVTIDSVTSMWIALTFKQVNRASHRFTMARPFLIITGPK